MRKFFSLLEQQEEYWRLRSRAMWLKEQDRNTKFFHRQANARKQKNYISGLINEDQTWCTFPYEIQDILSLFFQHLFSREEMNFFRWPDIQVPHLLWEEIQELCKISEMDEIENTMKSLSPWKAPGPNGVHAAFFQRF